jgi:hypothetical protein
MEDAMTNEIENLLHELPQAPRQRVEEIVTIIESVLSEIECKFPTEDDTDIAYECQYILKSKNIILCVREWNARDSKREATIHELSSELMITLNQIPLVSTDLNQ